MSKIQEIITRKNRLIAEATEFVTRTSLKTQADKEQHQRMLAAIDAATSDITNLQQIEQQLKANQATTTERAASQIITATTPEQRTNEVWRRWLKSGYDERIPEHRDLTSNSDPAGGAVVPQQTQTDFISQALKAYAPLAQFCRVRWSDNSAPVKVSRVDDRNNGLILIQEGTGPAEADPTDFSSSTVFYDNLSTGLIRFSNQLLQDSAFNLTSFLSDLGASRFGRGLEAILTKGKDSAGTVTPNNAGIISIAGTGTTTATLAAGVGWTDLVNLFDSVDAAYLPRAVWQMTSKTRNALAKLEDGMGRPFFVPAPNADSFDMLLGKPIIINQSLDQLGTASGVPIVFGSLYEGVEVVIRRLRVLTIRERWAELNLSAISAYTGIGSTALAPGALQKLVLAAS